MMEPKARHCCRYGVPFDDCGGDHDESSADSEEDSDSTRPFEDFRPHNAEVSVLEECLNTPSLEQFFCTIPDKMTSAELHLAAYEGNVTLVKKLLNKGHNVNMKVKNYGTPLLLAIHAKKIDVVHALIKGGADVNARGDQSPSGTPLACATKVDSLDIVKILIKNGANLNMKTADNLTLLHLAVAFGSQDLVKFYIDKGLNVNSKYLCENKEGFTPLHFAANRGACDITKTLLEHGARVDALDSDKKFSPLHFAAAGGHAEIVKILVDAKANVSAKAKQNCTPLHLAVLSGHLETGKILLLKGSDVNVQDEIFMWTPLHIATVLRNNAFVKLLVEHKANCKLKDHYRRSALHFAVERLEADVVELIMSHLGLDDINARNAEGIAPLHIAIAFDRPDCVKLLLKRGAYYDAELYGSMSPVPIDLARHNEMPEVIEIFELCQKLFSAARRGDCDQLKWCIKKGVIVSVKDKSGRSPLLYAISNGHKKAVNFLLANQADIHVVTNKWNSFLHLAALHNDDEMFETLLKHLKKKLERGPTYDYFVNIKTSGKGMTALHVAALKNNFTIVKHLLESAVIYNVRNKEGETPLQLTTNDSIKNLLQKIDRLFKYASIGNQNFVDELENVDMDTIKAVTSAHNTEHQNLFALLRAGNHSRLLKHYTEITLKKLSGDFFNVTVNALNL